MIKSKQQRRRNRRLQDKNVPMPQNSVGIVSVTHQSTATHLLLTFTAPVSLYSPAEIGGLWKFGTDHAEILSVLSGNDTNAIMVVVDSAVGAGEAYTMQQPPTTLASSTTGLIIAGKNGDTV